MADTKKIAIAQAPFDDHNCDIILRSANGVDFHVFKLILSLVSPVFKDMFALPQGESQSNISSVPVITVTESSTTLDSLLLLCYPAATPTFGSFNDAKAVMEAASKYDMQTALGRAGDLVMAQFLSHRCLDLYAVSCQFGWPHHARTAATRSLEIKDLGRPSHMFNGIRDISALDLHRLLDYHYKCGIAAQAVGSSLSWLEPSHKPMQMWKDCTCKPDVGVKLQKNFGNVYVTSLFHEYLVFSGKKLLARPCESTLLSELSHYNRVITDATECSSCRSTVVEDMHNFRALYISRVKKVIAAIEGV
ncbi:uncharacterized protein EDB93DRAFT_1302101 [Suillus bovinus]|uniref:uncharacterized protein n=1 Tax=Suillus bovinus TaxID=48563 RepID=UPI001B861599|nr:uncharacterized protein EDB93DRAFT_1302101 [Suillus bovinus]KAG2137611.1 hypothetical protein EDB93DRAFT_1302101 [Suillus bovinus]